jgi:hypothetical protein
MVCSKARYGGTVDDTKKIYRRGTHKMTVQTAETSLTPCLMRLECSSVAEPEVHRLAHI